MTQPLQPSIGRIVHYMAHGSADGTYPKKCRAAVVTDVDEQDPDWLHLAVLTPTEVFHNRSQLDGGEQAGGTWHWPERVS